VPCLLFAIVFPAEERRLLDACAQLMQQCGAHAVKIEGGTAFAPTIARLVEAGVPVMAHIGLLPQRVYQLGGYRRFGRNDEERDSLLEDAKAVEAAGAFVVLGEMIEPGVSAQICDALAVPFVGIGCGAQCDGQMLVSSDILGLTPGANYPSFVKVYKELGTLAVEGLKAYAEDVRAGRFPAAK
jgi:3-methyl-2-oxobutanoate hydroxymethyltransferase